VTLKSQLAQQLYPNNGLAQMLQQSGTPTSFILGDFEVGDRNRDPQCFELWREYVLENEHFKAEVREEFSHNCFDLDVLS